MWLLIDYYVATDVTEKVLPPSLGSCSPKTRVIARPWIWRQPVLRNSLNNFPVIYMQSNKTHNVVLMSKFYSALMLALHVSDLIGPSSGAFCTSCICRLWYVVLLCVLLDVSSSTRITTYQICKYSLYKTLLMMDRWGPKHVELT